MTKQTFLKSTLCLLMAMLCNVVCAQTFVQPEAGKYYKLKGDNTQKPWLTNQLSGSSIVVSANEADAAIFERTANGLRDVATGKFLGMNGSVVSLVANEASVTIGQYNDNNATGNGVKYSIKVVNGSYMYNNNTDGKTHESSGWITNIERYWGFIEVAPAEITHTLNVSDAKWASLMLGFDAEIPAGLTPYVVAMVEGGNAYLTAVEDVLPANTAVLINADKAGEYTFVCTTDAPAAIENNMLQGSLYDKTIASPAYALGVKENVVALYTVNLDQVDGTAFINYAYKAYLPKTTEAASISLRLDGATGIENAEISNQNSAFIYDLMGRRVVKMVKGGMYIVGGKKVIR